MRTLKYGLIAMAFVALNSPRVEAQDFVVRFENHTNRPIRIKTIKFGNQGLIALNNGRGFDLAPEGSPGDVQSAEFSGTDSRVIAVWDLNSDRFLAAREEVFGGKAFVGVSPQPGDPSRFTIVIGALP